MAELDWAFLEWLHDYRRPPGGSPASVVAYFGDLGRPEDEEEQGLWRDVIRGLHREGLVRVHESLEFWSSSVVMTPEGRSMVQERRTRRADPVARAAACREALMRWLYGLPDHGRTVPGDIEPFFEAPLSAYEGERLHRNEVERALEYLSKKGLIDGSQVAESHRPINPYLTDEGIDCVEQHGGRVGDYLQESTGRGVQNTWNTVNGDISGQVSMGNRGDSNQSQYRNEQVAPGYEAVAQAVAEVVKLLPHMGLQQRDLEDAEAAANEVLEEVHTPSPEPSKLRRGMAALKGAVAGGVMAATSQEAQEVAKTAFDYLNSAVS